MNKHAIRPLRQTGFSLIEIMIALVLGLFVLGSILSTFIASKQTYRQQDAMSRVQENARFAVNMLSKTIRKAGYRDDANIARPFDEIFPAAVAPFNVAGRVVFGTDSTFSLRYEVSGDAWLQNCLGVTTASNVTETLGVVGGELRCTSGAVTQPLLSGIQGIYFLYGEDTNADGYAYADRYVTAATVADWNKVVSVQVELLLVSEANGIVTPQPYIFKGVSVTPTDRKLYQVYKQVISLRNLQS